MSGALEQLDNLIEQLREALAGQDWDEIVALNGMVNQCVEPVMAAMNAGDLSATSVQQRLEQLQAFCDQAQSGAETAKAEVLKTLNDINRNQSAARAYQKVSVNRSS